MSAERPDILLVEDESDLASTLVDFLEGRGFDVDYAVDGRMALQLAEQQTYDALVLDLTLPRVDGLEVCAQLQADDPSPPAVLMLTARDTLEDRLEGFAAGADDYLVKPFALEELEARLRALLRRRSGPAPDQRLEVGSLVLCPAARTASYDGTPVVVTPTGRVILEALARSAPALVSRRELIEELWGEDAEDRGALRTHLYQLRRALAAAGAEGLVETLHGQGYRLREDLA